MTGLQVRTLGKTFGRTLSFALLLALMLALGVFFFFRTFGSFYYAGFVADNLGHFHDDAACMARGNPPYGDGFAECVAAARKIPAADVVFEYPPAAGALLWLLGELSGDDYELFQMAFMVMTFGLMLLAFMAAVNQAEADSAQGAPDRRARVFAASIIVMLSAGPVAIVSFDLLPALLTLGAVLFALRARGALAGALLGCAVAIKGYPVVLVPLLAAVAHRRGGRAQLIQCAAGFAAPLAAFTLAALAVSPRGFLDSFSYHGSRGLELNSVYAAVLVLLKHAGAADIAKNFDHGSWNLTGSAAAIFDRTATPLLAATLIAGTWRAWAMFLKSARTPAAEREAALRWTTAVLCLFMVFFKVGSPQFFCWAAPFMILLCLHRGGWGWIALFALAGHAATAVFPHMWAGYAGGLRAAPAALLLFSKCCLLLLSISLIESGNAARSAPEGGVT